MPIDPDLTRNHIKSYSKNFHFFVFFNITASYFNKVVATVTPPELNDICLFFAMLLILSDELSVWNRPRLKIEDSGRDAVLYSLERSDVPKEIKLSISEARSNPWIRITADKNSRTLKEKLKKLKCFMGKPESEEEPFILGYPIDVKA